MISFLRGFFLFLKHGVVEEKTESVFQGLFLVFKSIVLVIFLYFLSLFIIIFVQKIIPFENASSKSLSERSVLLMFLMPVIIGPILEELVYRLPLLFSRRNISISLTVFSYFMISDGLHNSRYFTTENLIIRIAIAILVGFLTYLLLGKNKVYKLFYDFWIKNPLFIFYFLSFSFAFSHLSNYTGDWRIYLIAPIITLPQLIYGLTYSFIRLKSGIQYSILIHMFINLIPFISRVM
jgi:Type II CAAX prenyl endopeptidase Rce1-like